MVELALKTHEEYPELDKVQHPEALALITGIFRVAEDMRRQVIHDYFRKYTTQWYTESGFVVAGLPLDKGSVYTEDLMDQEQFILSYALQVANSDAMPGLELLCVDYNAANSARIKQVRAELRC